MELEGEESYYSVVRLTLLAAILLLTAHCVALLYLRVSLGRDAEAASDGLPIQLCALSHATAWAQTLLFVLRVSGMLADAHAVADSAPLQTSIVACQWLLTPFAYLYHEAVGVGHEWGARGVAGRAVEASTSLALLALLLQGVLRVLSALLSASGMQADGAYDARSSEGGRLGFATQLSQALPPQTLLLQTLVSYAGLIGTLLSATRGALQPVLAVTAARPPLLHTLRAETFDAASCDEDEGESDTARRGGAPRAEATARTEKRAFGGGTGFGDADTSGFAAERSSVGFGIRERFAGGEHAHAGCCSSLDASVEGVVERRRTASAFSMNLHAGRAQQAATNVGVGSLLAEPLPEKRSLSAVALACLTPRVALRLCFGSLWGLVLLTALAKLAQPVLLHLLTRYLLAPAPSATPGVALRGLDAWLPRRALSAYFAAAAMYGHHLLCRYRLREPHCLRRAHGITLQSLLLEAAALQMQASALPAVLDVIGLLPPDNGPAVPTLCASPLATTAVCSSLLVLSLVMTLALGGRREARWSDARRRADTTMW
uniref:Uncharacterized protein n=1 Tax=Chrysotila carterae TaxID=13221 RepID=A0A7S4ERP8_CHRCT